MTRQGRSSWLRPVLLGLGASALFLWLTLRRVDLEAVGRELADVSLPVLVLALVTRGLAFLAMGLRSRATLAPGARPAFRTLVLSHLIGYTGNNVLPLRLGELVRIDYLARRAALSRSFLLGTVAVERLLDSTLLLLLFAATVPAVVGRATLEGSFPAIAGMTALALAVTLLLVRWKRLPGFLRGMLRPLSPGLAERVGAHAGRVVDGLGSLAHARWAPAAAAATVLYWLCAAGTVRVVIAAFGLALPWYAPFFILAVTALGTALPSSPGFVGTYHYFSALGVSLLGVDAATGASFAIVVHAVAFVPYTLLGLVVFARSIRLWASENVGAAAGEDGGGEDGGGKEGGG